MLGYWLLGDYEELVLFLLDKVFDELFYIDQLLNGLKVSFGLLCIFFKKIDNYWVGEVSWFKFVCSFYEFVKKCLFIN